MHLSKEGIFSFFIPLYLVSEEGYTELGFQRKVDPKNGVHKCSSSAPRPFLPPTCAGLCFMEFRVLLCAFQIQFRFQCSMAGADEFINWPKHPVPLSKASDIFSQRQHSVVSFETSLSLLLEWLQLLWNKNYNSFVLTSIHSFLGLSYVERTTTLLSMASSLTSGLEVWS